MSAAAVEHPCDGEARKLLKEADRLMEQLPGHRAQAERGAVRGEHLGQAALVDLDSMIRGQPEHEPDLIQRQDGEVRTGDEERCADDPVLAGEPLDQPFTHGLA